MANSSDEYISGECRDREFEDRMRRRTNELAASMRRDILLVFGAQFSALAATVLALFALRL